MPISSIHLAKVLHTFSSSVDGQLAVKSGECLIVLNKLSQEWINCRHVITGDEGIVPTSYVREMTFKVRKGEQAMFLAIADFMSGVEGDLEFRTGDLIIGEQPVNDEWWEGRLALQPLTASLRMFPLTFVVEIDAENKSQQPILDQHDNYAPQESPPFKGVVIADFEGSYDDELSLRCNDEVHVMDEVDQNWYSGYRTKEKQKRGMFPKSFVQFLAPISPEKDSSTDEVPLSRTWRAMHREVFEDDGYDTRSSSAVSNGTRKPEIYQNVPSVTVSTLPTVLEASPVKPESIQPARQQPVVVSTPQQPAISSIPAAYINFDEIFQEVRQSAVMRPTNIATPPQQSNPAVLQPSFSAGGFISHNSQSTLSHVSSFDKLNTIPLDDISKRSESNKYQPAVFDSRTLTQLSTVSLDDIVRYEMQRAVVEKQVLPIPPSRPPPPQMAKQGSISSSKAMDTFDFSSFTPVIAPTANHTVPSSSSQNLSSLSIARPRPTPSISPPPPPPPFPSRQQRSISMNFSDLAVTARAASPRLTVTEETPLPQLLPAYKPERPPAFVRDEGNNSQIQKSQPTDKRAKVIDELISTEESYLADLELCCQVISQTPVPAVGAGVVCNLSPATSHPLLGNMSEVAEVSRRLLDSLKTETTKPKDSQLIGSCFVKLANELEAVYSRYCQHQPGAAAFLARLNQVDATRAYVSKVTDIMKNRRSSAFSLESILLKPVQRILKYPLLLSELTRATGPQHPDTEALASAAGSLSKLTGRLNETRRRLDLVLKYRRSPSLTARLSRAINVHTIRKKTARFSQRLSDSISFSPAIADQEFTRREQEFIHADKLFRQTVRTLQRWTEAYNEFAQAQRELVGAVGEFTAGDVSCQPFAAFREQWFRAFDTAQISVRVGKVNALSVDPLRQLVELFGGPGNVMKKRADKLLDFRRLAGHQDANSATDNELSVARTDFLAINAQLSEELPSLCRFSYRILLLTFVSFLRHYSLISRSSALGIGASSGELACNNLTTSLQNMVKFSFVKPESNIKSPSSGKSSVEHTPVAVPRASLPAVSAQPLSPIASGPVIDTSSSMTLHNNYSMSDLFMTTEPTVSRQLLELALPSGALVGILKRHDPTGQPDRWFVDTGVAKGFVPRRSLRPFTPSPSVDAMLLNLLD